MRQFGAARKKGFAQFLMRASADVLSATGMEL